MIALKAYNGVYVSSPFRKVTVVVAGKNACPIPGEVVKTNFLTTQNWCWMPKSWADEEYKLDEKPLWEEKVTIEDLRRLGLEEKDLEKIACQQNRVGA